jgi:pre-rRNA-processing protein TSR3
MQSFPPTVILRHQKENLKKCSLKGLEKREDFVFYSYPCLTPPPINGYILLSVDAMPLSKEDSESGLLILDGTWKYADKMCAYIRSHTQLKSRSVPREIRTAYPRHQTGCLFPEQGLASIEAIYIAYHFLGRGTQGLLDNYFWKKQFLENNSSFLRQ